MSLKLIYLDKTTEKLLDAFVQRTGISKTGAVRLGISKLYNAAARRPKETPYEIYKKIELHDDCGHLPPATEAKSYIREMLQKEHEAR